MRNRNRALDSDDYYAASPYDASFPDYPVYSKRKRKSDPRSMINLKKIKKMVTDVDAKLKFYYDFSLTMSFHLCTGTS